MADISHITIPIDDGTGTVTPTTFTIKDAQARQAISALGNALKWIGVTTTELEDGDTTNPITIDGESHTAAVGEVTQYSGEEFAWDGTHWQSLGKNNFGELAFVDEVEASYTPVGTNSKPTTTTDSVYSITAVGTLPSMTVTSETLVFDPGTLPTKGSAQAVVTDVAAPTFTGTAATITSAPAANP